MALNEGSAFLKVNNRNKKHMIVGTMRVCLLNQDFFMYIYFILIKALVNDYTVEWYL